MITISSNSVTGVCPTGGVAARADFYITENADLKNIPNCAAGSSALDLNTGAAWILRSDGKWHKLGTTEVYGG